MNKRQEDLRSTFTQMSELFDTYSDAIAPFPSFVGRVTTFNETCTVIDNLITPQETDITGLADDKAAKRSALESCMLTFSGFLLVYAEDKEDAVLIKQFDIKPTYLSHLAQNKVVPLANSFLDFAKAHAADLIAYRIDDVLTAKLKSLTAPFEEAIPKPKLGKVDKSNLTEDLDKNFTKNEKLLKKISRFMALVKDTSPVFYETFFKLYKVVSHGTGKLAVKGSTLNDATGKPEPNVTLILERVVEPGQKPYPKKRKKSSPLGNFNMRSSAEGKYIGTAKKLGFKTQRFPYNVISGERTNLVIRMVPE